MLSSTPPNTLATITHPLKQYFQDTYQDNFLDLILFGSQARGDADPESDIDILVILAHRTDPVAEIKRNNIFISDLSLEYDQLINCIYLSQQDWQTLKTPLVQNILDEGVIL